MTLKTAPWRAAILWPQRELRTTLCPYSHAIIIEAIATRVAAQLKTLKIQIRYILAKKVRTETEQELEKQAGTKLP